MVLQSESVSHCDSDYHIKNVRTLKVIKVRHWTNRIGLIFTYINYINYIIKTHSQDGKQSNSDGCIDQ